MVVGVTKMLLLFFGLGLCVKYISFGTSLYGIEIGRVARHH